MKRRVVITGVGSVSAVAASQPDLNAAIGEARSAITVVFEQPRLRSRLGARVPDAWLSALAHECHLDPELDRCLLLGLAAARQAVTSRPSHEAMFIAVGLAGAEITRIRRAYESLSRGEDVPHNHLLRTAGSVVAAISHRLGIAARAIEVHQNACAAGLTAIGSAADALRNGEAEIALAGGVEVLDFGLHAGFDGIRALSPQACRPFDAGRNGTVLGEGAAFFLLETMEHALGRGAAILAELCGFGMSNDAYHRTRPDPSGAGQAGAMVAALADSEVDAHSVDLVYAHGTGTPANDEVELSAIGQVLGDRAPLVPIVSIKGATGHTIAASGPLNIAYVAEAFRSGAVAANTGLLNLPVEFEGWSLPKDSTRQQPSVVLVNAFAFGGNNASAVIRRWSH